MKKIIPLSILLITLIVVSGCTNKYDECVQACMDTYPSYSYNQDYMDCKQGCIDRHK